MLRDLRAGDPQALAAARVIAYAAPDILLLTRIDYDADLAALTAFATLIGDAGHDMPHRFALRPNTGWQSGADLDGDGRMGEPEDAHGYADFAGQNGMALLSRHPVEAEGVRDFSRLLWSDLPDARLPEPMSSSARATQRLSNVGHWDVPIRLPGGARLRLWAFHATPPVFDGPDDRNGLRNHDEAALWLRYLDGTLDRQTEDAPFVLLGDTNLDPADGDGRPGAMTALLSHPQLQDPRPSSAGGPQAALSERGVNDRHRGDPALDTANWPDGEDSPGNLRVDYVLPSRHWHVVGAGVLWPEAADPLSIDVAEASRHRLVWVDVVLD